MTDPKDPKPSLSNSVKGPQAGLRYRATTFVEPKAPPDFIAMPDRLRFLGQRRLHEMTDIPRDAFKNGAIDLDKMPIRGTQDHILFEARAWLREAFERDGMPHLSEQWPAIEPELLKVRPPKLLKNLGQLDRWLDAQSTETFREKMQEVPGFSAADVIYLTNTYRTLLPQMHAEVQAMAERLIALEYHLPHHSNIERDR